MELKQYQATVLQDLKEYLGYLNRYHNYVKAYNLLWESKGVKVGGDAKMKPYKNVLPTCLKCASRFQRAAARRFWPAPA